MLQNLPSAAVVTGALRVKMKSHTRNHLPKNKRHAPNIQCRPHNLPSAAVVIGA